MINKRRSKSSKWNAAVAKATAQTAQIVEVVDHPAHYKRGGIEAIDVIEAWDFGFCLGNAVKYIARAGVKDAGKLVVDLEKARWYLDREIARLKSGSS